MEQDLFSQLKRQSRTYFLYCLPIVVESLLIVEIRTTVVDLYILLYKPTSEKVRIRDRLGSISNTP